MGAPAPRLRWTQVMAWRAARHHLDERVPAKAMLEVVARIAGLHAQVMSSAELTLAARVEDVQPGDVRRALWEERTLVKTWAMRGTLHLLPSAEFPMWQAALATRQELERLNDAVAEALDGQLLTREELAARVGQLTGSERLGDKLRESWGRCSSRPPPARARRAAEAEAERLAAFSGGELELSWVGA